jgi:hypothetical protein
MLNQEWSNNRAHADNEPDWIWQGLVAPRHITLLTGLWKAVRPPCLLISCTITTWAAHCWARA